MSRLRLFLVHDDDLECSVLDGGLHADAAKHARPEERADELDGTHLRSLYGDKNDLGLQGYCVIAPVGERGDKLLEELAPLIKHRKEELEKSNSEAANPPPIEILRVPTREQLGKEPDWETAVNWVKKNIEIPRRDEKLIPYYRLILGDLHEVPVIVQQALTVNGLVGRLAFDNADDYRSYAEKVVKHETRPVPEYLPDLDMYSVLDGSDATDELHAQLVTPAYEYLYSDFDLHYGKGHKVHQHAPQRPSPAALNSLAGAASSSVLYTLSHGTGAPRTGWKGAHEKQRRYQGSMSFGPHGRICADDVADKPFLPGGAWFMNACFSAGTPDFSVYEPWLRRLVAIDYAPESILKQVLHSLPADGVRPFIAGMPKAALANPDGPLAFIGHIDLTWTYSFGDHLDPNGGYGKRIGVLQNALRDLSLGHRFGTCFNHFTHYLNATIASEFPAVVSHARAEGIMTNPKYLHLWMMSEDLRGYTLLGDPAARILAPGPQLWRTPRPPQPTVVDRPDPIVQTRPGIADIERAIGYMLTGSPRAEQARSLNVTERDLQHWFDSYRRAGRGELDS